MNYSKLKMAALHLASLAAVGVDEIYSMPRHPHLFCNEKKMGKN